MPTERKKGRGRGEGALGAAYPRPRRAFHYSQNEKIHREVSSLDLCDETDDEPSCPPLQVGTCH
eukprot:5293591-Prymnesium_polylepis.1